MIDLEKIIIIYCFCMTFIGYLTEKKILNPITVFFSVWTLIFYLYNLKLYKINVASEVTLQIFLVGFVSFSLGFYFIKAIPSKYNIDWKFGEWNSRNLNSKLRYDLVLFLCYISIFYYCIRSFSSISCILSGNSLAVIRASAQANAGSNGGIITVLGNVFFNPIVMALQPIIACEFLIKSYNSRKLLILNILLLFFRTMADGSRSTLIYFAFHILIAFTFYYEKLLKQQKKIRSDKVIRDKNNKKKIKIIGSVVLFFIILTTISRSGNNLVRYAYYYFTMEPYMFEQWSKVVDSRGLVGLGLASTNGFTFYLFYILKNLRILSDYPSFWHSINTIIGQTDSEWQVITTTGTPANAYVSLFWFFYLDGRILAVTLGSFIYGAFSANFFVNAIKKMSAKSIALYSFVIQGILMSFVRLQFSDMTYAIAFIIIFAMYRTEKSYDVIN